MDHRLKTLLLFLLTALLCLAKNELTPAQKAAIATRFAAEVKYNFQGYDQFAQNYDSICRAQLDDIVNTPTDEAFNDKIQLFANQLRDGHTGIGFNADVSYAPITQKRFGNKVFVTGVYADDYTKAGVRRGTELDAIDDMPVLEYGNKYVVPYVPSSTPQWSAAYPFGSINLTKGPRGMPVKLTFRNGNGPLFDVTDQRQSPWDVIKQDMSIRFDSLPGNIGLLTIPSFRTEYFDLDTFATLYQEKIMPTDGLIVDVRDNVGGNSQVAQAIMMFLATDSIPQAPWSTPDYKASYASWGQKWQMVSEPSPTLPPLWMTYPEEVSKYDKPIVLLVNALSFSSSEGFAMLFKNANRGKVVGMPTGGSTGNPILIDLGWGYYGRICTRHEQLADGTQFYGIGILPDIYVEDTEAILDGKDVVLEEALRVLKR